MGLSEIANHTGVTVLFPVSNSVDDVKPRPVMWTTFDVHRGWWGEQLLVVQRESPKWWETEVNAGSEE